MSKWKLARILLVLTALIFSFQNCSGDFESTIQKSSTEGQTQSSTPPPETPQQPQVDSIAPNVSVTVPGQVSGMVNITATASDNVGVVGVRFFIDNAANGNEDFSAPYMISVDTSTLANGMHTLFAIARDSAGNSKTSAIVSFEVNNSSTPTTPTPTTPTTPPPASGSSVCPPYPAFPDANCTGWEHTGVKLKKVPSEISSGTGWNWEPSLKYVKVVGSSVVLDGLDMGCIFADAGVKNLEIKRSRISGNCDYMVRVERTASPKITLTDVEIVGGAVQMAGTFTWLRVKAHGFTGKAAMMGTNSLVEDSYIYGNICNPPDHQSAIGTNGGASNVVIRHNNVDLTPSECTSGGIANYDDFGAFRDILIEKNLVNSAGYCLKAGFEDNNAAGNSGMQVIDNVFGRKYYANCGSFGVVSNWMPNVSGNVWRGNVWGDGAAASPSRPTGSEAKP